MIRIDSSVNSFVETFRNPKVAVNVIVKVALIALSGGLTLYLGNRYFEKSQSRLVEKQLLSNLQSDRIVELRRMAVDEVQENKAKANLESYLFKSNPVYRSRAVLVHGIFRDNEDYCFNEEYMLWVPRDNTVKDTQQNPNEPQIKFQDRYKTFPNDYLNRYFKHLDGKSTRDFVASVVSAVVFAGVLITSFRK